MADKSPLRHVLAHTIVYLGQEYSLSVASISESGDVKISPFKAETQATTFFSGRIIITPLLDPETGTYSWEVVQP